MVLLIEKQEDWFRAKVGRGTQKEVASFFQKAALTPLRGNTRGGRRVLCDLCHRCF
jgi:hypothetical protein